MGEPCGRLGGRSRMPVRPIDAHSLGIELSPSSTWISIERCPCVLVQNSRVTRAGSGVLRGMRIVLHLRIVFGSIPAMPKLWAFTFVTLKAGPEGASLDSERKYWA